MLTQNRVQAAPVVVSRRHLAQAQPQEEQGSGFGLTLQKHSAFGMWANRPEAQDPVAFAEKLRRKVETRQDG